MMKKEDDSGEDDQNVSKEVKRAHHNALERKRRDHIKESFSVLRDQIPTLSGEKASRAAILNTAREYIQQMRVSNQNVETEVDELKKQNDMLAEQIRILENQVNGAGGASNGTGNGNGNVV
eukprot:Awhi_evm1s5151